MRNILILFAILFMIPESSFAGVKAIYGDDNRKDYYETAPVRQQLSDSVVSFWKSGDVINKGVMSELEVSIFGRYYNLCDGERFENQYLGAFCSGALISDDLVMTAAHCVKTEDACKNTKLVFGFKVSAAGQPGTYDIPSSDVYSCKKIEASFYHGRDTETGHQGENALSDYAIIRLDRKVSGHKPLAINWGKGLKEGDGIFVIGYPTGIPLKVADGAKVRSAKYSAFYQTDLDTFGGNSGSPVFNEKTNAIEGILVRGGADFVNTPEGCKAYAKTGQNEGRGEDVTKVSEAIPSLMKLLGQNNATAERSVNNNEPESVKFVPPAQPDFELSKKLKSKIKF